MTQTETALGEKQGSVLQASKPNHIVAHPIGSAWIVDGDRWEQFDPIDGAFRYTRKIYISPDSRFVLKASPVTEDEAIPQSWAEGLFWTKRLFKYKSRTLEFVPTLSFGSTDKFDQIWAWNIQPYLDLPNAHTDRHLLPGSPFMRYRILEAREYILGVGLNSDGLRFRGEYVYNPNTGMTTCVDYGKVFVNLINNLEGFDIK